MERRYSLWTYYPSSIFSFNPTNQTRIFKPKTLPNLTVMILKGKRKWEERANHEWGETRVDGEEHILEQWQGRRVIDRNVWFQNAHNRYLQNRAVEVLSSRAYWLIFFFFFMLQVLHFSSLALPWYNAPSGYSCVYMYIYIVSHTFLLSKGSIGEVCCTGKIRGGIYFPLKQTRKKKGKIRSGISPRNPTR